MKLSVIAALTAALSSFTLAVPITEADFDAVNEANEAAYALSRRDAVCESGNRANTANCRTVVQNVIAGGTRVISVNPGPGWKLISSNGNCYLYGQAAGSSSTSSYSRDVGYGARSIVDFCAYGGTVAGRNTAGGNGNFKLWLTSAH